MNSIFDTFKPNTKTTTIPFTELLAWGFRSLEYKFYKLFISKSKEEKIFSEMAKHFQKA